MPLEKENREHGFDAFQKNLAAVRRIVRYGTSAVVWCSSSARKAVLPIRSFFGELCEIMIMHDPVFHNYLHS